MKSFFLFFSSKPRVTFVRRVLARVDRDAAGAISKAYHMNIPTNIRVSTTARRLDGQGGRVVWRGLNPWEPSRGLTVIK